MFHPLVKKLGLQFKQTFIPITQGCFVQSLVEFGSVVLEKKSFKCWQCILNSHFLLLSSPWKKKRCGPFLYLKTWLPFSQSCFMQSYINKHCLRNINAPLVQNSRGHLLARCIHCPKFRDIPEKGSTNIEWINFFKDQQFDLDLWPSDLKTKGVMYSTGASIVPSLVTFKQGDQEILSGGHFFKDQQFWHWPLTMWPQNQYGSCTP